MECFWREFSAGLRVNLRKQSSGAEPDFFSCRFFAEKRISHYFGEKRMKARRPFVLFSVAMLLIVASIACSKAARTDAQVVGDVQSKLFSDSAIQSRQITVSADKGVVTLNGTVASDTERNAAATDASGVEGVKTVVNNLQAAPAQAQTPSPEPTPAPAAPAPEPPRESRSERHHKPSANTGQYRTLASNKSTDNNLPSPTYNMGPSTPPPPPPPVTVSVPADTTLAVRLVDPLDSGKNRPGDTFRASLDAPVYVNDKVAIPSGADIMGRVVDVKDAAHFAGRASIAIELTSVDFNGHNYPVHTSQFSRQGAARGTNTAEKVGGGAALGAIIGAIAGGGKGAAIGAGVGAGAGTGVQAMTKGQQVKLSSEQVLNFQLQNAVTVTPAPNTERNSHRQKLDIDE
jgi:hypothetical protein